MKERKVSLTTGQVKLENIVASVTTAKPKSKAEELEDIPQILPISQEAKNGKEVSDTSKNDVIADPSMPVKEDVKAERRQLSFQEMGQSSGSELTPSPEVQRRRKVSNASSSSEDIKT